MNQFDVDAQGFGHLVVESARANFHAQACFGNEQIQTQSQQQTNARHEQAVDRIRKCFCQRDRGAENIWNGDTMHIVAPQNGAHLLKNVNKTKGQ